MNCSACKHAIQDTHRYLECRQCRCKYHIECLNVSKEQHSALTSEYRSRWICPSCNNITKRTKSNVNTPVRQTQVPPADESMNVSYECFDSASTSSQNQNNLTCSNRDNELITMDKMSNLLDQKLQAYLSTFTENFRKALKVDVHNLVQAEMDSKMQQLKDDFTVTTDFICEEQTSLKREIDNKSHMIKDLELKNARLQTEINLLGNRLASIEKMTRNQNLEIQAVPEGRSDNPGALFQNLCKIINLEISEDKIHSCRRVAKLNPSSDRPRNILVTLVNPRLRDQVLSACHRYNKMHKNEPLDTTHLGLPTERRRIYVTEHLSPEIKALHAAARKVAREKSYVRKEDTAACIHIKDLDTLKKL